MSIRFVFFHSLMRKLKQKFKLPYQLQYKIYIYIKIVLFKINKHFLLKNISFFLKNVLFARRETEKKDGEIRLHENWSLINQNNYQKYIWSIKHIFSLLFDVVLRTLKCFSLFFIILIIIIIILHLKYFYVLYIFFAVYQCGCSSKPALQLSFKKYPSTVWS